MQELIDTLKKLYPNPACTLEYDTDYQLLFNTRLAAQCTDKRVNLTAKPLYERYPTLQSIAEAELADMEEMVHPCGFYRHKARDLVLGAQKLLTDFDGKVPDSMEALLTIPGVGRKTANLILGELFGQPAVVVDTHCIRLSNRLGLCDTKDPAKAEKVLREKLPPEEQLDFCHRLVEHGRAVCTARQPRCAECGLTAFCQYYKSLAP